MPYKDFSLFFTVAALQACLSSVAFLGQSLPSSICVQLGSRACESFFLLGWKYNIVESARGR